MAGRRGAEYGGGGLIRDRHDRHCGKAPDGAYVPLHSVELIHSPVVGCLGIELARLMLGINGGPAGSGRGCVDPSSSFRARYSNMSG